MIDPRNTQSVVEALGQAPLDAIGAAVRATREDLTAYRSTLPAIAARHTQRGILNWVHDQFFAHARAQFQASVKDTSVVDREPTRDIYVGHTFRFRLKKHTADDMVSSYPTDAFLAFSLQDPPATDPGGPPHRRLPLGPRDPRDRHGRGVGAGR